MRRPFWLPITAGAMLAGCASVPNPVAIGPNHPANPAAASAPLAELRSPLKADLAAATSQPQPRTMPKMHMKGMDMKGMDMKGMNMGSMPQGSAGHDRHRAGENQ